MSTVINSLGRLAPLAVAVLLPLATIVANPEVSAAGISAEAAAPMSASWSTYLFDNGRTGFNRLETTINPTTAANLRLLWTANAGAVISAQPTVGNDLVYWGAWDGFERATFASGPEAGQIAWKTYVGRTSGKTTCRPSMAGVASTPTLHTVTINGKPRSLLFMGGGGNVDAAGTTITNAQTQFFALDALTGAVVWQTPLGPAPANFAWSSPAYLNGSLFIGTASLGDCPLTQAKLLKLNATTGAIQAEFKVVRDGCVGGGIWGSPSIDSVRQTVYINTGTPSPCNPDPYGAAVVELRASDLKVVGSWAVPRADRVVDSDFGSVVTLFSARLNGTNTLLAGVANKNGRYYVFKRDSISAGPIWTRTIATGGQCPTCGDGSISPSAWDGHSLYVAGGTTTINGASCRGSVRALDPATGNIRWQKCLTAPVLGAVTVVPGVVIVDQFNYPTNGTQNRLTLLDAGSGRSLAAYPSLSGSNFYGAAAVANGVIYVGDVSGKLYAFGL